MYLQVVLICGASSGIGEELAYQLAARHCQLVLVARTESKLVRVRDGALKAGSPRVEVIAYDFSNVKRCVVTVLYRTIEIFGRLDYLILNHGLMPNGPFLGFPKQQDPEFIQKIYNVNVFSYIQLATHAIPHLERTGGHIHVTSSMAGEIPQIMGGLYCATKHSKNGFFYSLQQELLHKRSRVTLNIGAFGLIVTREMKDVYMKKMNVPKFLQGDLKECVKAIIDNLVLRKRTLTFPRTNRAFRFNWYINPFFHEFFLAGITDYNTLVQNHTTIHEQSAKSGYQKGSW